MIQMWGGNCLVDNEARICCGAAGAVKELFHSWIIGGCDGGVHCHRGGYG